MNITSLVRSRWWPKSSRKPARQLNKSSRLTVEPLEDRRVLSANPVTELGSGKEIFVSPTGDDWNSGSISQPFQTIRRALDDAAPGDIITLRNGVHQGGVRIDIDAITIRSMPGEWAVVEAPLTQQNNGLSDSVFQYSFDTTGGKLENLEIVGGYWYGVMMWDWWDSNMGPGTVHVGASDITIEGCKIHDTGVDAVKITPGCNNISIINNEIYNAGRRSKTSSDGIDNNNGDGMIARGNYIHNIPGIGILTSGGTIGSVIEQNLIKDVTGAGITVGFYSELEWMEPDTNPNLFTSINTIARNNVIVNPGQAGIGIYASLNPTVTNNTIVNSAKDAQAPLQFGGVDIWISNSAPSYANVASVNPVVMNNIITSNNDTRMVDIREGSIHGSLTLDYNLYYSTDLFGARFIDRNLTGDGTPERFLSTWQNVYGYDQHSMIADPQLSPDWHLTASSPAIGVAISLAEVTNDIDGNARPAQSADLGADEFGAGPEKTLPPARYGAPSLEIAQRGYHDFEGNTIQVRVVRNGQITDTVTVYYSTLDGTAKSGQDYIGVSGMLTFAPGETEKFITVALGADTLAEGDEHFLFTLSNPATDGNLPVRLGHQSSASMTIDDLDTPPIVSYRVLYVAPDGSDVTGDGSEAKPWKSLQFAADSVGAGDFVIVKPGLYDGMMMTRDGKPDARITFHGLPGAEINDPDPIRSQDGINLEGADFVTIEGFYVHGMPRAGLRSVSNEGVILRNNVTDNNGYWGILTGWSEDIVVENNIASRSNKEHGIYISNSADDAVVRNNIVWGNRASGIQFNADAYLPGDGVHSRNLIEGNVIYENGKGGGAAINLDAVQDSVIRNNLLYNNHATGIVLYVGYGAEPSTNNLVENNTVVGATDSRYALLMWNGSSGNTIVNNILLSNNPNRGSMSVEHNSLPAYSNNNILGGNFELDGYSSSFASWQQFSGGADANSLFATMTDLFVDPTNNDYRLKVGSPALDAGDIGFTPDKDVYGQARPQGGAVDIGALEAGTFAQVVEFDWSNYIGYEMTGLAEVTVKRSGSTAGTLTVDYTTTGGTAIPGLDYTPTSGQIVFLPGESVKRFKVFVGDDSTIEDVKTVGLQLSNPVLVGDPTGLVGDPTGVNLGVAQATLNLVSDDVYRTGKIEFDAASVTVDESSGLAAVTLKRVGGSNGSLTVHYETGNYTPDRVPTWYSFHTLPLYPVDNANPANLDNDYLDTLGSVTFAEGETQKTIYVSIVNDDWYEGDEAFVVKLTDQAGGANLGARTQTKVRIHSDDVKQPGQFVFGSASYEVTEGTPTVQVTIHRLGGSNVEADVRLYDTAAPSGIVGSAWAGADYGFPPQQLHFAPGETQKTISIPVTDDTSTEGDEAFSIKLYSPSNDATIGDIAKTVVTIHDNESTFYFQSPTGGSSFTADESVGTMPVKVVRQGALTTPASVRVRTGEWGSAQSGIDFLGVDVTLNFAPGEAFKMVNVPIVNDAVSEPQESFSVSMSNVVGASQGSWSWSANISDDDQSIQAGKFQFSAPVYQVMENGGSITLTVNRVDGSAGTATVKYAMNDGATGLPSAYGWSNYTPSNGTLTFAPGETSKTITVPIIDNTSISADKYFTVSLSNPGGGAILGSTKSASVKIVNDDSTIDFGSSMYTVFEGAGFVTVTLVRNGSMLNAASVDVQLSSWAGPWNDFVQPANMTVEFAAGESTKELKLQLIDDASHEGEEWFNLKLANVQGSKLGYSYYSNIKVIDNES